MPIRVPTVTGPSVAEGPLPDARQTSIASPELLGGPGREVQALGTATENLGGEVGAIRQQLYQQANAARVDDALNQAQEAALRLQHDKAEGFTAQTGYAALNRDSGMPLADEYTGKLNKIVSDIRMGLANDDQRRMFSAKANNVVTGFYGQAMTYEAQQQKDYTLSVKDASVANAKNALTLNATDPANVQLQTTRIRAAIEGGQDENGAFIPGSAQMQGKSASWAKEKADEAISDAHGNAVKNFLESGNVNAALGYFNRHRDDMTAKDVLEVRGKLQTDYDTRLGASVADQVWHAAQPKVLPTEFNRLTALVTQAESNGQRYGPNGGLLTSPKGAKGEMQVLDSTNRDPGFGVTPAKDDSPDERARVGRDYLGAMVRRYGGDIRKALAAYNAGPGAVDAAVKSAGDGLRTGSDFLAYLPKETQAYVSGISTQYANGAGVASRPTLADLHDQVRAVLGPSASPLAVKTATEQLTQRYSDADKAVAQRKDEVIARAMQGLTQNGGRFSELPASLRTDLTQFAPEKVDDVLKFGQRVALGDDTTNPALYLRLSDPNVLRALSDSQLYLLRGELSQQDYQHFAGERSKLLNPMNSNSPGDLNSTAVKNTLDQRLRELKIDPTPKDDGGNDAARVGTVRRVVDSEILALQRSAGKKFNDAETAQAIDRLFATNTELRGTLGISTYRGPVLAADPSNIPTGVRIALTDSFRKMGVDKPTDAQLLNAFMHLKLHEKPPAATTGAR
jgi:hypothetical protein